MNLTSQHFIFHNIFTREILCERTAQRARARDDDFLIIIGRWDAFGRFWWESEYQSPNELFLKIVQFFFFRFSLSVRAVSLGDFDFDLNIKAHTESFP